MPKETKSNLDKIVLHHADGREVSVTSAQEDRFVLSVAKAVTGCQIADSLDKTFGHIQECLDEAGAMVRAWAEKHPEVVAVVVGVNELKQHMLVITEGPYRAFSLEPAVAELEADLALKIAPLPFCVHMTEVSDPEAGTYFDLARGVRLYAKRGHESGSLQA